jgi:hypothetical protein
LSENEKAYFDCGHSALYLAPMLEMRPPKPLTPEYLAVAPEPSAPHLALAVDSGISNTRPFDE